MKKTVSGVTTEFLYDGLNPVQELNGSNGVVANLLTGLGIDERFTRTDASGAMSFLTDALGSTIGLVNAGGSIATSYTYDPFGATTIGGTSNANPYQFTGRENDGNGLYFYRARYYSPGSERFSSQDPLDFAGGDTNLYKYVGSDPVDSRDPSGLLYWNGNWGGPGWSGGEGGEMQNMTIEQLLHLKPAINEEDQCYEDHDFCFSECETSGGGSCSSSGGLSCGQVCNASLVHCLQGLHKQSAWSWLATFYFTTHDPNPTPGSLDHHGNFDWHPGWH